jgi:hypothetical protein
MKSRQRPRSIRQDIAVQQVGTEILLYDERRHMAFCLNESSAAIWKLADGERTVEAICDAASLQLKAPLSEEFVLFALEQLREDGLLEPELLPEAESAISRRALLKTLGVSGALLLPMVAAIVAPPAAAAYNGCVDCSSSQAARARRAQRRASPPASSPQK